MTGLPRLRPRDAATLIVLDRRGGQVRVLMGRRNPRHAFMPGKFVFPGGRTDPGDSRVAVAAGLHPAEEARLALDGSRAAKARASAIALSALRETCEEAGLLIGQRGAFSASQPGWAAFAANDVRPSLDRLRLIARAITPPRLVRRFDSRFFACWHDDVAVTLPACPTDELESLDWIALDEAGGLDVPDITRMVLEDLSARLAEDPGLRPGGPAPFYRHRHNRFLRTLL